MRRFSELKFKLLRKGIPPDYIDRLIQELAEHQDDIKADVLEEHGNTPEADLLSAERLGGIDELTEAICSRMRERTFIGRHPRLSYVFLPMLAFTICVALAGLALSAAEWVGTFWLGSETTDAPAWVHHALVGMEYGLKYVLTALIAYVLCRTAERTFCGIRWAGIGALAMVFFTFFVWIHVPPPDEGFPRQVQFQIGVGLPVDPVDHTTSLSGLYCFLKDGFFSWEGVWHYVPLLILGWQYIRIRRRLDGFRDITINS